MGAWRFMLGGLIVWAVHFFALYAFASIFLSSTVARVLTLIATAVCLAADLWLLRGAASHLRADDDEASRWIATIALLGAAISLLAVVWQGFPALLA